MEQKHAVRSYNSMRNIFIAMSLMIIGFITAGGLVLFLQSMTAK